MCLRAFSYTLCYLVMYADWYPGWWYVTRASLGSIAARTAMRYKWGRRAAEISMREKVPDYLNMPGSDSIALIVKEKAVRNSEVYIKEIIDRVNQWWKWMQGKVNFKKSISVLVADYSHMWYDKSQKLKRHLFYMQASVLHTRLFISGKTHAYNN